MEAMPPAQPAPGATATVAPADVAFETWRSAHAALAVVVGHRGALALYRRSLHLASSGHPFFSNVAQATLHPGDFIPLRTMLSGQTSSDASAANAALMQTFYDLLAKLVGESLPGRLLGPEWKHVGAVHVLREAP